jgi:hydroxymethylpyrimidine pyrophosphatase-like HAD family hydrolase
MILVTDVDRTLIDAGARETPCCRAFFRDLRASGVTIGIASARSLPSILEVLPFCSALASFIICSDGALLFTRERGQLSVARRANVQDVDLLAQAFSESRADDSSVFVFSDDRAMLTVFGEVSSVHQRHLPEIVQDRPYVAVDLATSEQPSGALSVGVLGTRLCAEAVAHDVAAYLREANRFQHFNIRVFDEVRLPGDLWWCDVSAAAADKKDAMSWLLAENPTVAAQRELVVLCDGLNDMGLATLADLALCPPWAAAPLAQVATTLAGVSSCDDFVREAGKRIHERLGGL